MNLPRLRRILMLVFVSGLFAAAACAQASSPVLRPRPRPAPPPYVLSVEDEWGAPLPSFQHRSQRFVLGEPGQRYNVRVRNATGRRIEVVVSVDGRDAVSGEVADYKRQRGYLVGPYASLLVEGFRSSLDDVALFRFIDAPESYSSRRGTPENVGIIGVAVFPERSRPAPPRPLWLAPEPSAPRPRRAPSAQGAPAPEQGPASAERRASRSRAPAPDVEGEDEPSPSHLGTEYGERRRSSVVEVPFERAAREQPAWVSSVRYDDAEGLEERGIDLSSWRPVRRPAEREPLAFPGSRFAQPPD